MKRPRLRVVDKVIVEAKGSGQSESGCASAAIGVPLAG